MKSIIIPNLVGSLLTSNVMKSIMFYMFKFHRRFIGRSGVNCFIAADCAHSYMLS